MSDEIHELELSQIDENYASLRIVNAKADATMLQSIKSHGQMSPVVCLKNESSIELIDGFKRLRALRELKAVKLKCIFVEAQARVGKARIIQLNQASRSISDIEEAMVLQSLHKGEGLSQVEIAALLGRDKSWVCRRISLIERLADEVRQHVELGLISASIGRELARLPRGNQKGVLTAVIKHRMGKRGVEKLVRFLMQKPPSQWSSILYNVCAVVSPVEPAELTFVENFSRQLAGLKRFQKAVIESAERVLQGDDEALPGSLLETTLKNTTRLEVILNRLLNEKILEV